MIAYKIVFLAFVTDSFYRQILRSEAAELA